MLRRVAPSSRVNVRFARSKTEYNFGQVDFSKAFVKANGAPPHPPVDHGIKVTTLSNGVRCITHNLDGAAAAAGLYIEAGAKYDPKGYPGISHMMRYGFTTSNMENSMFQIDKTVRANAASFEHCEVNKKWIGVRTDARTDMWQSVMDHIITAVAAPRFCDSDLERMRDTWDNQLEEQRWLDPRTFATDRLESVAFYREGLGSPRLIQPETNDKLNHKALLDHYSAIVVPSRIVIAGVNVEHAELIARYENAPYPHSAAAPHHARSTKAPYREESEMTQYTGGEEHHYEDRVKAMGTVPDCTPETIVAVGFKAFGREQTPKQFAASMVAQSLLDVATNDGIRYLREEQSGLRSFYRPYSHVGLLGFTARAHPQNIVTLTMEGIKLFRGAFNEANLESARARALVQFASSIEVQRDYLDFLATSLATGSTKYTSAKDVLEAIKSVTMADVKRVKDSVDSASASLFVTGDSLTFPNMKQLGL